MSAEPQRVDYDALEEGSVYSLPDDRPTTIGGVLKAARVAQNKKLPAISRELKISQNYLESLEEGDVDAMPERVYTLGFVRTYATYLGLDTLHIVERFKQETLGYGSTVRSYTMPESYAPAKGPSRRILSTSLLLLVLLGGGWLVYHFWYDQAWEITAAPIETPPQTSSPPMVAPTLPPAPPVTQDARSHEPAHPVFSQEAEDFASSLQQAPSQGAAPIAATTPSQEIQAPESSVPTPTTYPEPTLIFSQESWLQIRDHQGNIVVRKLLHPGQTYTLPKGEGFSMRVGNGAGVRIAHGQLVSAPLGGAGEIVSQVLLDPAAIEGYLNRH